MFLVNLNLILWTNFLNFCPIKKKTQDGDLIFHFSFIYEKFRSFDVLADIGKKKKTQLNWKLNIIYPKKKHISFISNLIKHPRMNNYQLIIKNKSKMEIRTLDLNFFLIIAKFTKFLIYIFMLKKFKTNPHKKIWRFSSILLKFYCLNNFLFIKKFLKKFPYAIILKKLEKNGIISINKIISNFSKSIFFVPLIS